jgi:hypothetical protein
MTLIRRSWRVERFNPDYLRAWSPHLIDIVTWNAGDEI